LIPGEYRLANSPIECNKDRNTVTIRVANTGDRPVQIGSHFHFFEVNSMLSFPRKETVGMRLNIAAGTAVRFEPGEEKEVELVAVAGNKHVYGLNALVEGDLVEKKEEAIAKARQLGFKGVK